LSKHLITGFIWAAIAYAFGFVAFGLFELFNATETMTLGEIVGNALRAGLTWPMTLIEAYTTPQ
jgi:hypothetical protein